MVALQYISERVIWLLPANKSYVIIWIFWIYMQMLSFHKCFALEEGV